MNKLTTLLAAALALALISGPAIAAEMTAAKSVTPAAGELWRQLSPKSFGTGYVADGVSPVEFRGTINEHYGVAPAWEGRPEDPLTLVEKAENNLKMQLAPRALGYNADGVSGVDFRGFINKHYGVAPAWEGKSEPMTMIEKTDNVLRNHLGPNITYGSDIH